MRAIHLSSRKRSGAALPDATVKGYLHCQESEKSNMAREFTQSAFWCTDATS